MDGHDELKVAGLTLEGITRGGVQTALSVREFDVMFDIGGFHPAMLKRSRFLVTHGHHDHLGGLPYLVSIRSLMRSSAPTVHIPQEIEDPLRRIFAAWAEIENFAPAVTLIPQRPGDEVRLRPDLGATCVRSSHRVPSLCWSLHTISRPLRDEFRGRPGAEIRDLKQQGVEITHEVAAPRLAVTGDTTIDLLDRTPQLWDTPVLVHEVTSWDDRRDVEHTRKWGHTHVDEMIERVERFSGEALVLVHRSLRHSKGDAERVVAERFPSSVRDRVHVFGN